MNIFIVYAHPDPKSFDGILRNKAVDELTALGHKVQLSDLYDMRFKPEVMPDDFTDLANPSVFDLHTEQAHAAQHGTFSPDILAEQQKILWADLLILQFPLWWYSVPAILKGWIDRVLAYGFAYGRNNSLMGRRAMLVMTTGGPPRPFTPEKLKAINQLVDHIQHGTLSFCGFDVLPPFAVYGAANATPDQREQFLKQYTQLLHIIESIEPMHMER